MSLMLDSSTIERHCYIYW